MNFLTLVYGLFLLSVVGLFWSVPTQKLRVWVLFVASLIFYGSLQLQYVPLLLVASWINFFLGRALGAPPDWRIEDWQFAQQDWTKRRMKLLWLGIGVNLVLLLSFKYVPVILTELGRSRGWNLGDPSKTWSDWSKLAPMGLSYFSFECISYLVDVYRGAPASQQFLRFATSKLFFAKVLLGPITRYHLFAGQLQNLRFPPMEQIVEGLWLIACGAVKKAVVADSLATYVNLGFDNVARAGSGDILLCAVAYGLQLYLDFSGYVDVARGSALLLGFNLPQNFDFPYFTTSIADFWRRWHMSLGDWLRNYLYFPLGGSRQGLGRTCVNLIVVMVLAGLWHGAAWGFLLWGAIHGLALAVHRIVDGISKRSPKLRSFWESLPGIVVGWGLTQSMVFLSWIVFRLPEWANTKLAFVRLLGAKADPQFIQKVYGETLKLYPNQIAAGLFGVFLVMAVAYALQRGLKLQLNWYLKLLLIPLCFYMVAIAMPSGVSSYLYFDF
jgi:alginate O-acetyltransferase complex protein AlgI